MLGANEEIVSRKEECQMLLVIMNKVKTVCSSGLATWNGSLWILFRSSFGGVDDRY